MFVLKREIHKRTMIPGKAEIDLYRVLLNLMETQDEIILKHLRLYPAVDLYDLQLRFEYRDKDGDLRKEVWAVDVKDYHIPETLGNEVKPKLDAGIHDAFPVFPSNLAWHRAFYVVPEYREIARDGYCDTIRVSCGSDRFRNLDILTDSEFIQLVKRKVWEHSNV